MPGKLATALTNLAALTVTGVAANYGIGSVPSSLVGVTLPVLMVQARAKSARRQNSDEFEIATPSGSSAFVVYRVAHLLFHSRFIRGGKPGNVPSGLVDLLDNYATAMKADPRLSGALFEPAVYEIRVGPLAYGASVYYGARIWHSWKVVT